ncbi:MAG: restriction endonuclease subunit S [Kiritimatiellae bacterium]|nr:restriction endonuclease subunit S [Kiritimatiellia bacterium]
MKKIVTATWKPFALGGPGGLFDIVKGTRLTKSNMRDGAINFVGASAMNNGITAKIANDEHIHSAGTISVSYNGSIGEAFYQAAPFWASDDINVLYPRFTMSREIAMFFLPLIRRLGKNFAFSDKWTKDQMEKTMVPLPATSSGAPDFAFMENYMKGAEARAKAAVDALISASVAD